MKQAIVDTIVAVTTVCPDCKVPCENASGSQMIACGENVTCPTCHQDLAVSQSVFRVRATHSRISKNLK